MSKQNYDQDTSCPYLVGVLSRETEAAVHEAARILVVFDEETQRPEICIEVPDGRDRLGDRRWRGLYELPEAQIPSARVLAALEAIALAIVRLGGPQRLPEWARPILDTKAKP